MTTNRAVFKRTIQLLGLLTVILVASKAHAATGWLGPISDESWKNQGICGGNNVGITAAECVGRYCDDMYFDCENITAGRTYSTSGYWSAYFSDEGQGTAYCQSGGQGSAVNGLITGVKASGSYSDNISVLCNTLVSPAVLTGCHWTGWFSEEQGLLEFGPGEFAAGARCSGSYCDNMSFYVCGVM